MEKIRGSVYAVFVPVFVPTVLLEERARTFQDALDKLYEDQSAAEYVEYFEALEKLLANYHTTIRIPAADAALALAAISATPASRCSSCGRAPPRGMLAKPSLRNKNNSINPDACPSSYLASMLS